MLPDGRVEILPEMKAEKRPEINFKHLDSTAIVAFSVSAPAVTHSTPPKADVGAGHKLKKGMKKSQVIALFGTPKSADTSFVNSFTYHESVSCPNLCWVNFDQNGRVTSWSEFRPEFTTDLDDTPMVSPGSLKIEEGGPTKDSN